MHYRDDRKSWILYPEDPCKMKWDLLMTLILIIACVVTPFKIAFEEDEETDRPWQVSLHVIDALFLIDIFVIFRTAYYDDDFRIIDNYKVIAKDYLSSWFLIDFCAVIPFSQMMQKHEGADVNSLIRITRVTRLYKFVKLAKLIRIFKIIKERGKLFKYINEVLKIGGGFERIVFFLFMFLLICHIVACLWIFTARIDEDESNWINGNEDYKKLERE